MNDTERPPDLDAVERLTAEILAPARLGQGRRLARNRGVPCGLPAAHHRLLRAWQAVRRSA